MLGCDKVERRSNPIKRQSADHMQINPDYVLRDSSKNHVDDPNRSHVACERVIWENM